MKKIFLGLLLVSSLSTLAATNTDALIKNISNYSCERKLEVLLDINAEAHRLSNAAIARLMYNEEDKHGLKLDELANAKYESADAVKKLLIDTCFKE